MADLWDHIESKIKSRLPDAEQGQNKLNHGTLIALAVLAVAVLVIAKPLSISGDHINVTNKNITSHKNITNENTTYINNAENEYTQWGELPLKVRRELKKQTITACPQIKNIGDGVSWDCANEYLASQGVRANNVRDLFR